MAFPAANNCASRRDREGSPPLESRSALTLSATPQQKRLHQDGTAHCGQLRRRHPRHILGGQRPNVAFSGSVASWIHSVSPERVSRLLYWGCQRQNGGLEDEEGG